MAQDIEQDIEMNIIFDLSEVLIRGLWGIEHDISRLTGHPPSEILPHFWGDNLDLFITGKRTEDAFLTNVVETARYPCSADELRAIVHRNFVHEVPGSVAIVKTLARAHDLYLLSDHAREWIDVILRCHPWLSLFKAKDYSYDFGTTKRGCEIFRMHLAKYGLDPKDTLFIDDNPGNIENARSCGLQVLLFTGADRLARDLEELGLLPPGGGAVNGMSARPSSSA